LALSLEQTKFQFLQTGLWFFSPGDFLLDY
jgi:hypothetical protein